MKTIIKSIVWIVAVLAVSLAILYGFWLVLIFMLFGETLWMWLAITGEVILFYTYWRLIRMAEC